ncbi:MULTISPECIES: ABC-F family ATPase [Candidatus Ichthyocystis]|uniref:Probable ATP-binding protein YbiT n=1 Tax=Candidatus Ichthyocystis hellenicum TaxID=1561003 RepID=A0A0S4M374_9BURK|nr:MULTISPECIES: ABC-F family ATPase [Ichthyocystis]CUT17436.1 ABC transporter ATP-binding protein [Candidatus Ichthyocystis hellenicum]
MPLIASGVTVQFGSKPLFENVSVKFGEGNRYGLIGANGAGKSTFMKVLGGGLDPLRGEVSHGRHERVSVLRQDQFGFEEQVVIDVVLQGHEEMWAVLKEKDAIYASLEATEDDYIRAGNLEARFSELDGYTANARAAELLCGVGILTDDHNKKMSEIAPGFKLRVLLAQALFADPDIMLLDEPTNNLDIYTIKWLEDMLNTRQSTMIIISHDRHFLNAVCTHIADLDYCTLKVYPGNYDEYMEASTLARTRQLSEQARAKEKVAQLQDFVRRFSANKSKSKQATSRLKQIEKIKVEDVKPSSRQNPFIRFDIDKKMHRTVLEIKSLAKSFPDNHLFSSFWGNVQAGEKIAVVGANGVGKSTLLKLLMAICEPDAGGTVSWSSQASLGYYPQDHGDIFQQDISLFDWMMAYKPEKEDDQVVRATLGKLLFSGDDVYKKVSVLSGGERGRALYGRLMLEKPNVLVMDEPTNHMDMESIESLNYALELYPGTVIFVSHDRQFVSSVAQRIWAVSEGKITDYLGTYDEYLESLEKKPS